LTTSIFRITPDIKTPNAKKPRSIFAMRRGRI
jgi:hypothetical protein